MRAVVRNRYALPPDGLELREVEKPTVGEDEVLVRVRASSVNPVDRRGVVAPSSPSSVSGPISSP